MKATTSGLNTALDGREFIAADLLTITLKSGTVTRYTSLDADISYGGNTYLSGDLLFSRGRTKLTLGAKVAELEIVLYASSSNLIGGMAVISACRAGVLDGATIRVDKAIIDTTMTVAGAPNLFVGIVGGITCTRTEARVKVLSLMYLLNAQFPRNVISPPCVHTLWDDDMLAAGGTATGCTLLKSAFAVSGSVLAGSTIANIIHGLANPDGYFDQGHMTFTSGVNSGKTVSVKSYTAAGIVIAFSLLTACGIGDTFTIYPGCDHQKTTCSTKFNNLPHFKGFPFVPSTDTAF